MTDADLQRIAEELGEPIEIVRDMNDALKCCADEGPMEAHGERVQAAREAYWDSFGGPALTADNSMTGAALDEAIETAIRVRVDADVIAAALEAYDRDSIDTETNVAVTITAAFRAAGFEVQE
jgi:hypothetical protein